MEFVSPLPQMEIPMRITQLLCSAIFAALFVPSQVTAEAAKEEVQYGKYFCITDRAVGFQSSDKNKDRFAGKIELPPERQRFVVTIRKVERKDGLFKDGTSVHDKAYCFNKDTIDRLDQSWETGGLFHDLFSAECLARYTAEITHHYKENYWSLKKHHFESFLRSQFWIFEDSGKFVWWFRNLVGDRYMAEGRCELLQ